MLPERNFLRVQSANGGITLVGEETDRIQIDATVRAVTAEREAAVEIVVDELPSGGLDVRALWPGEGRKGSEGVSFKIRLPADHDCELRSSNGSVTVEGLRGQMNAKTSNGRIRVSAHRGPVVAKTSNGSITLRGDLGPVQVGSSNGSITIDGARETVHADSSNGGMDVALHPEGRGPLHLHTSNASVSVTLSRVFEGSLEASCSNGRVRLGGNLLGKDFAPGDG